MRGLVAESALLSDEATTTTGGRRRDVVERTGAVGETVAGVARAAADGVAASDAGANDERGGLTPGVRGEGDARRVGEVYMRLLVRVTVSRGVHGWWEIIRVRFFLKYHQSARRIAHKKTCEMRHPPGNEIYRHPPAPATDKQPARAQLRIWEVDGSAADDVLSKFVSHRQVVFAPQDVVLRRRGVSLLRPH